jgi:hypothetical protein
MLRVWVRIGLPAASALALLATIPPVAAQSSQQCADTPAKQARRSMFGSILGNIADSALGRAGVPTSVAGVSLPVGSLLSDAIINLLDCHERQQAAKATDEAVRGGVGTEVAWTSDTRPNVTGKSKVTGQEQLADGGQCLTVTDVVIVDGQETTVPKRMCRAAGASGYTRA